MKKLLAITFVCCAFSGFAQNDPQKMIDEFFTRYKTKSASDAVDYIFSTNKWMDDSKDEIESIKIKLNGTLKLLGNYYGYSLIRKTTVGDSLSSYTFLVRHDRQPLRFKFVFYNADRKWGIFNFSYDDSFDEEFQNLQSK